MPDVWALKYNVHIHDRARISPGYWFVAPYLQMDPDSPTNLFDPYQVGPYIYDGDGVGFWPSRINDDKLTGIDADLGGIAHV